MAIRYSAMNDACWAGSHSLGAWYQKAFKGGKPPTTGIADSYITTPQIAMYVHAATTPATQAGSIFLTLSANVLYVRFDVEGLWSRFAQDGKDAKDIISGTGTSLLQPRAC